MKKALMIAAICAALTTAAPAVVSAEGLTGCCKKPLRAEGISPPIRKPLLAEGATHMPRPLLACNQNLCHVKRPLVVLA